MKDFLSLLAVDLRRAILSKRFLLSVCGVTLILFLTVAGVIAKHRARNVVYLLGMSGSSGSMVLILGLLPLFPFAVTYASEWEERAEGFWIIRAGTRSYAAGKAIAAAISAVLVTACGMALFVVIARLRLPLITRPVSVGDEYSVFLNEGHPVWYLIAYIADISLSSALFAEAALWISTYIPNRFVAVAAPLTLYYLIDSMTYALPIPQYLKPGSYMGRSMLHAGSPEAALLIKLCAITFFCLLMGVGATRQIGRRVRNG